MIDESTSDEALEPAKRSKTDEPVEESATEPKPKDPVRKWTS